jgi:hypothetical protein
MLARSIRGTSPDNPRRYQLFSRMTTKTFRDSSKGSGSHVSERSNSKSPVRFNYDKERVKFAEDFRASSLGRVGTGTQLANVKEDTFSEAFADDQVDPKAKMSLTMTDMSKINLIDNKSSKSKSDN